MQIIWLSIFISLYFTMARASTAESSIAQLASIFETQYPIAVIASPDLDRLLVKSRLAGRFKLAIFNPFDGKTEAIDDNPETQLALTWSPDGSILAWLQPNPRGCGFALRILDIDSKKFLQASEFVLPTAASPMRFSPDGRRIALVGPDGLAIQQIARTTPHGSSTTIPGLIAQPAIWLSGVHGGSDFVWFDDNTLLVSKNDGSGSINVVDGRSDAIYQPFPKGSVIRQMVMTSNQDANIRRLAAVVRTPDSETDVIRHFDVIRQNGEVRFVSSNEYFKGSENFIRPFWIRLSSGLTRSVAAHPMPRQEMLYVVQVGDRQSLRLTQRGGPVELVPPITGEIEILGSRQNEVIVQLSTAYGPAQIEQITIMPGRSVTESVSVQRFVRWVSGNAGSRTDISSGGLELLKLPAGDHNFHLQFWPSLALSDRKAIIWVHGGPHLRSSVRWNPEIQEALRRGFDFLQINYPGSTGYGRKFEETGSDTIRVAAIEAAMNYIKNRRGIDFSRMVTVGSSYGGYLAAVHLRQSQARPGASVLLSPGTFDETGMVDSLDKRDTRNRPRVLLFQGARDCVIPPDRGMQTLNRILGSEWIDNPGNSRVVFRDEGHHFHRTNSRAEFWRRLFSIFDQGKA